MIGERPDLEGRARVRRLEAGVHADLLQGLPQPAIGDGQGYRLGAGHVRQLGEGIPIRDVGVGDGEAARPPLPPPARQPGEEIVAKPRRARVDLPRPAQAVLERQREEARPALDRRHGDVLVAAVLPDPLVGREPVRAVGGVVDPVGDVDALVERHAVERPPLGAEQGRDAGVGAGLVPELAGEDRRVVLMADHADRAVRVEDPRRLAGMVVLHHLELEAPRRLVVADDLDDARLLLVAGEEPVPEQERSAGRARRPLAVDGHHHARVEEEVRARGVPLERAVEREERELDGRAGLGAGEASLEQAREFGEGEGHRARAARPADHEVEERPAHRRETRPGVLGVHHPLRGGGDRRGCRLGRRPWRGGLRFLPPTGEEQAGEEHQGAGGMRRRDHGAQSGRLATRCVPAQQSSATLPLLAKAGPSRLAISAL